MKNLLVTGGAGFIGSHLVDALCRDDRRVTVIDNLHRGRAANLETSRKRAEFIEGDIRDRTVLAAAMRGMDAVYHLAAQSNVLGAVQDLDYSFGSNVSGTFEVLRAAAAAGVQRVVFTSSREVYGDPTALPVAETAPLAPKNAYGASKAAGEMYCRVLSGDAPQVAILRLANVYGPRDFDRVIPIFLNNALQDLPLTLFGGNQTIDFVDVETVVKALIRVGEGEAVATPINVGSGKPTTVRELAKRITAATDSQSEIRIEPAREVEVSQFVASTELMQQRLGLTPPDDPLHKLSELIEWTRQSAEFFINR